MPRRLGWLALAALAILAISSGAAAQSPARPSLDALVAPLYQQLAALKGVQAPGPPPPVLIRSRDETRRFMEQELDRRYSPARLESERKGMVAWGLIPPDYDLKRLFLDLMQEQIAAYYDPRGKVMVVGDWLTPEEQQAALLHELVHALQDREIPLDQFIAPDPGRGDQLLARQALIEGEAVAMTFELVFRAQGKDFASMPDVNAARSLIVAGTVGARINAAPKFLRELILFSYMEGLTFVHQFRRRHPWSAMPTLYRDPPRSTTQILHPDKRLVSRQDPIPIDLPDLGALLPAARQVADDELGEFALGAVLGLQLGEEAGRRAAVGWRGDRYRIWEDDPGDFVMAYVVALESERLANTMALHLTGLLEKRHPSLAKREVPGAGAIVTWQERGRTYVVEKRGARVLLLERVPSPVADQVRETIWRSRLAPAAPAAPKR